MKKYLVTLPQLMAVLLAGVLLGVNFTLIMGTTSFGFPSRWLSVPTVLVLAGLGSLLERILNGPARKGDK